MTWKWNPQRLRAANLAAEDRLTDEQIAVDLGVTRRTLANWRDRPEFRLRIERIINEATARAHAEGVMTVAGRVQRYKDRLDALDRIVTERAADPALANVPGGKTGFVYLEPMLVKVYDASGQFTERMADLDTPPEQLTSAKRDILVNIAKVDLATMGEMRQIEKQAAQDQGQWSEKHESSQQTEILVRQYVGIDLGRLTGQTRDADSLPPAGRGPAALP